MANPTLEYRLDILSSDVDPSYKSITDEKIDTAKQAIAKDLKKIMPKPRNWESLSLEVKGYNKALQDVLKVIEEYCE
jgi:hypothetical protein